jgi:hypothetical protein
MRMMRTFVLLAPSRVEVSYAPIRVIGGPVFVANAGKEVKKKKSVRQEEQL